MATRDPGEAMSKTILCLHGAWLTPLSWEHFRSRFENRGFEVVAPPWPYEDVPIEELRSSPDPRLKKLTIKQIVDHYERIVRALAETPILMGHSYGGLFVQLLLDRGLGACGVAIDTVPPRGVIPSPRMLATAMPVLMKPFGWNRVLDMSFDSFANTFAQTLPEEQKRAYFEKYWAPTPGRIYYQGAMQIGMGIESGNPQRPPLLLIAGAEDKTVTSSDVEAAYKRQKKSPSLTDFKIFPGRSHFLIAEPGWQEVADYALDWAIANQRSGSSR
jgi:pimeloyl-ACP methyl ester carboxylesterase